MPTDLPKLNHVLKVGNESDESWKSRIPACWRCGKRNTPYCTWKNQGNRVICKKCHEPADNEY